MKRIPGAEDYAVDEQGNVYSLKHNKCRKLKKTPVVRPSDTRHVVGIHIQGRKKNKYVHRLVLETFVGPCPKGMECCHYDGNPLNNCLDNLRWDTSKNNTADMIRHKTTMTGERNHFSTLVEKDVLEIREKYSTNRTQSYRKIGNMYNVSDFCISRILSRKSWAHV